MEYTKIIYISLAIIFAIFTVIILLKKRKNKATKTSTKLVNFGFFFKISELLKISGKIDEQLLERMEEILIQADVGVQTSLDIIEKLRAKIKENKITSVNEIQTILSEIIRELLLQDYDANDAFKSSNQKPFVVLFTGVNGVGKTTTIAKLAKRYTSSGKSVLMVAADTFRAAAIDQLSIWAKRAGAEIMKQQEGADPSSVVYDGMMKAKKFDVVLIDTAGRQHTKVNLMNELAKIERTIKKVLPDAPQETLLVVDATTGQNAITQAEIFNKATNLTGLVLTKLDGTAKGGIVIGIKHQLGIPIKLVGMGETYHDLHDFNVNDFVDKIFG